MSVFLGIDTSSTDLSMGFFSDGKPLATSTRYGGNAHAEHITGILQSILTTNGICPDDIDGLGLATGPGSFTGLRIGCAFIKGFCFGNDIPVLPVSSLLVLAHAACTHNGTVIAAIDARNDKLFQAKFAVNAGVVRRITDDTLVSSDRFYGSLSTDDIIVTDTMGYRKSTVFDRLEKHVSVINIEKYPLQRGLICSAVAANTPSTETGWSTALEVLPNYLRRSTPEERLRKKSA
jgi:tRNA threonylcarbamoyladenosine biosynthesis protein TsaB